MAVSDHSTASSQHCPTCLHPLTETPRETYCERCGHVTDDAPIHHGYTAPPRYDPEAREQTADHATADRDLIDRGLGSQMGYASERDRDDHRRVRWGKQAYQSKGARNRGYVAAETKRIAAALDLGDALADRAARIVRDLHAAGGCQGHDLDELAAASVYLVCRVHQRGLTPDDVAAVARCDRRPVYRRLPDVADAVGVPVPPPDPRARLRRVAAEAGVGSNGADRALTALEELDDTEVARGSPSTLAAALLYQTTELTQAQCAEAAGVTPPAIRQRVRAL